VTGAWTHIGDRVFGSIADLRAGSIAQHRQACLPGARLFRFVLFVATAYSQPTQIGKPRIGETLQEWLDREPSTQLQYPIAPHRLNETFGEKRPQEEIGPHGAFVRSDDLLHGSDAQARL
jgi:hypothetical protein